MTSLRLQNVYISSKILEENITLYSITNFSFLKELLSHSLVAGIRKNVKTLKWTKIMTVPLRVPFHIIYDFH